MPFEYREAWLAAAVEHFKPDFAAHGPRWGRTDASVAEPGAYLAAVILVLLFALFLWGLFQAATNQSTVSQRGEPIPVKRPREISDLPIIFHLRKKLQASVRG